MNRPDLLTSVADVQGLVRELDDLETRIRQLERAPRPRRAVEEAARRAAVRAVVTAIVVGYGGAGHNGGPFGDGEIALVNNEVGALDLAVDYRNAGSAADTLGSNVADGVDTLATDALAANKTGETLLLLVASRQASGAPPAPTLSQEGVIWTRLESFVFQETYRLSVFSTHVQGAMSTTGFSVTMDWTETQAGICWVVAEFTKLPVEALIEVVHYDVAELEDDVDIPVQFSKRFGKFSHAWTIGTDGTPHPAATMGILLGIPA